MSHQVPDTHLIPADKHDHAAIARARALGFPALTPHIPELLEWLQDPNWPVFNDTADLLAESGPALLPHVRRVLVSDDAEWISTLLQHFVPTLPSELLARLAPDIAGLATRADLQDHPDIPGLIRALTAQ